MFVYPFKIKLSALEFSLTQKDEFERKSVNKMLKTFKKDR